MVRRAIRIKIGHRNIPFADPGYFELSAPESSGVGLPAMKSGSVEYIYRIVEYLVDSAHDLSDCANIGAKELPNKIKENGVALRSALQCMRSNLPLVQILRLKRKDGRKSDFGGFRPHLDWHRDLLIRLLNAVRLTSGCFHREFLEKLEKNADVFTGVLYLEEIIWLYNEIAVICRWQGDLIDANSVLAQAEALRREGQGDAKSDAWAHLQIQRGAVEVELGEISRAMDRLEGVRRSVQEGSLLQMRAVAYLALSDHIRGERDLARSGYISVLKYCRGPAASRCRR